jgi:hypothetical protein
MSLVSIIATQKMINSQKEGGSLGAWGGPVEKALLTELIGTSPSPSC